VLTVWLCSRYERAPTRLIETTAFRLQSDAMDFYEKKQRDFALPKNSFWAYPRAFTFTIKVQLWRNGLMSGLVSSDEATKLLVEGKVTIINDQAVDWIMSTQGSETNGES
jgi:hypothetical protein